jgi:hypothetical protein
VLIGASEQFSFPQFAVLTVVYVGGCMLVAVVAPGVQVRSTLRLAASVSATSFPCLPLGLSRVPLSPSFSLLCLPARHDPPAPSSLSVCQQRRLTPPTPALRSATRQPVLGFAGVVVVIMAYILPGIMLTKMKLQPSHTTIGVAYVVFGVLVGALSFIEQVIKLVS